MGPSDDFARAFGDSLKAFLDARGMTYTSAAEHLGVTKAALSTYWTDDRNGKRKKPRAELLFRACIKLEGFTFNYGGYRIAAETFDGRRESIDLTEQLYLDFSRQFKLTEDRGHVAVKLKRHPGRVELSVSLEAAS